MRDYTALSEEELLVIVGRSCPDRKILGPEVVFIRLWDGRAVLATYCNKTPERVSRAKTMSSFFLDLEPLRPLVSDLLEDGAPFITISEAYSLPCILRWSLVEVH